jgi:phytoene synthase
MTPELAESYAHCAEVARREARNFYPSFLLLPADPRRSMCALYAFLRRSDDIADDAGTAPAKRAALDAWRTALDAALRAGVEPAPSPGSDGWPGWPALADTVRRHAIPARYLGETLDGVESDIEPAPFDTFDELYGYCYRVASAVGLCCIHIWGFRSEGGRAEELAEAAGLALQLTNIVRDVGEDARNGRVYLPREDLDRFGVRPEDLVAGRAGEPLRRLLAFEARRAYDYYDRARPLADLVSPEGRPVLAAIVGVYRALLDEISRRGYDVLARRVTLPAWRKAAIAARAYAGRLRLPSRQGDPGKREAETEARARATPPRSSGPR